MLLSLYNAKESFSWQAHALLSMLSSGSLLWWNVSGEALRLHSSRVVEASFTNMEASRLAGARGNAVGMVPG